MGRSALPLNTNTSLASFVAFVTLLGASATGCKSHDGSARTSSSIVSCNLTAPERALLTQIAIQPRTCSATNPCPRGSLCDAEANDTCQWRCLADSDCGVPGVCTCDGVCSNDLPPGVTMPDNVTCPRNPDLLTALKTDSPQRCEFDDQCPYGSNCDKASGKCSWECSDPTPACTGGKTCDCYGRCVAADTLVERPKTRLPELQIDPKHLLIPAASTSTDWTRTLEVALKTTDEDLLMGTGDVRTFTATVTVNAGANLQVACAAVGSNPQFQGNCDLSGSWSFSKLTDGWFARRSIWVKRAPVVAGVTDDYASWLVTFSSTLAAPSPQTATVSFKDAINDPPSWTDTPTLPTFSAYAGTITIRSPATTTPYLPPSSGVPPLTIPIKATISTNCGDFGSCLVIRDQTKVLTPEEVILIPLIHNGVRGPAAINWVVPTAGATIQGSITATIKSAAMRQQTGVGNLTGKLTISARIDGAFPNDYRDDFDTGNPNQYEAIYNLQRLSENTTCSASNACSSGKTCLNGYCISPFRTNLADFCENNASCPAGQDCVFGFCGAGDLGRATSDMGLSNTSADRWGVGYGDFLSSVSRPTEVNSNGEYQSNWFDDPYSPNGLGGKFIIGSGLMATAVDVAGYYDPEVCNTGFGSFLDGLSQFSSTHGSVLPAVKNATCDGLACLCAQTAVDNHAPGGVRFGSIACVDPNSSQGLNFYLDTYSAKNARCDAIWEQIRQVKERGQNLPFDFHQATGDVGDGGPGCVPDPHGSQLVFMDTTNGNAAIESHDIWFCRGWADAVLLPDDGTVPYRELAYGFQTLELPMQSPGLALAPFPLSDGCQEQLFGPISGDALICHGGGQIMQGVPLLSHRDDVAAALQSTAFEQLGTCISELNELPPVIQLGQFGVRDDSVTAALRTFFPPRKCFDPARFYGTVVSQEPKGDPRFRMRLLQQWTELHSFVANQTLLVEQLAKTQAGAAGSILPGGLPDIPGMTPVQVAPTQLPAPLADVLQRMEEGWALVISKAKNDRTFSLTTADVRKPDYRPAAVRVSPGNNVYFNGKPLPDENYEQQYGLAPALMEGLTAHMKLLKEYLDTAANKSYLGAGSAKTELSQDAITRFGAAMRFALAIEEISTRLHQLAFASPPPCTADDFLTTCAEFDPPACSAEASGATGTCLPSTWSGRWDRARSAYFVARTAAVRAAISLSRGRNPLGIDDDDIPLFFGDLTGTNSRFFASSDYLINTWAVSAVASARGALSDARDAWIKQRDSKISDEQNANDRDRRLEALKKEYGSTIAQSCGLPSDVGVTDVLSKAIDGQISLDNCFVDLSKDECTRPNQAPDVSEARNMAINDCITTQSMNAITVNDIEQKLCTRLFKDNMNVGDVGRVGQRTYQSDEDKTECDFGIPYWDTKQKKWIQCDQVVSISHKFWGGAPVQHFQKVSMVPCTPESYTQDKLAEIDLLGPTGQTEINDYCTHHVNSTMFRNVTVSPRKPGCYRGDIGAATVKGVRARQDVDDAIIALQDLISTYEIETKRCVHLAADATVIDGYETLFSSVMTSLEALLRAAEAAKDEHDTFSGMGLDFVHDAVAAWDWLDGGQAQANEGPRVIRDVIADANRTHDAFLRSIDRKTAVYDCTVGAEKIWLGFDATRGTVVRRLTDLDGARIEAARAVLVAQRAISDGKEALTREENRTVGTYSYHYWFDEKVDRFKREFAWAKRLVYLSLRAVEYEFQQTLPLRNTVLTADHPDQLEAALQEMQTELATRTIGRRRPEQASVVVSLRDDILGIQDRTNATGGQRAMSASLTFRSRLWDDKFAVRDNDGHWMGQGIPFTFAPQGALTNRCAERLWRATATIQGDGLSETQPGAPVILLKRNTFGSQWCDDRGVDQDTTLQLGSIQPSRNLFRDSQATISEETRSLSAASLYPWFNVRRADFYKDTYRDGASEELAGRGLYGDYVLLFPRELLEGPDNTAPAPGDPGSVQRTEKFPLSHVEDVLLRFDYLSVDNLPAVAQ